jgi:hypothetical protein
MPTVLGVKLAALSELTWVAAALTAGHCRAPGSLTYNILKHFTFSLQTAGGGNEKKLDTT